MSKRFLLIGLGVVLFAAVLLWLVQLGLEWDYARKARAVSDEEMSELMAGKHGPAVNVPVSIERLDPKREIRLAIGNIGLTSLKESDRVSDLTLAELRDAKGLDLVERQALDKALNEFSLSAAGLVRAKDAVRVGKLVRADWFLLGSALRLNGTNFSVVRMVDARTGISREVAVFDGSQSSAKLASALAGFVQQCRRNAAEAKAAVYLGVGTFQDVSVNTRLASLPAQLRSYLMNAFQSTNITVLEREFVNTLLQEMRLDLAGLTEEAGSNAPAMQSAYWMVDGFYQSYETTNVQVELVLNVRRMFGRSRQVEIRERPGEPLFRRAKTEIENVIAEDKAALVFSRTTEMKSLMHSGRVLAQIGLADWSYWPGFEGYGVRSKTEIARTARNIEEAIRAFETVLLLDPMNREARMCLATCFRNVWVNRMDEARDIYRELIESDIQDQWSDVARGALVRSFQWTDPESKRQWYENAAQQTANSAAAEFYRHRARHAAEDVTIRQGASAEAERLAEERLFKRLESFNNFIHRKGGAMISALGMDSYAAVFGTNRAIAAKRLAELFPKMKAQFPEAVPYLLATIVTFQVDTNSPLIAEFERTLEWSVENPEKLVSGAMPFWSHIRNEPYPWALKNNRTGLAVKILETILRAAGNDMNAQRVWNGDKDKMALAYGYLAMERWQEALDIFETYANRPVYFGTGGPWGRASTVILPNKQADFCREKLGLARSVDPREFDLGEPCLRLHGQRDYYYRVFLEMVPTGFWAALKSQLVHVDFSLKTNFSVMLSMPGFSQPSALCVGQSNVWIGTAKSGLVEVDKTTGAVRHYSERDGLLRDEISALYLGDGTLWIGYGDRSEGGLGRLDLGTRKFSAFTGSITGIATETKPPRVRVSDIRGGPNGEIWLTASDAFTYRPSANKWELQPVENGVRRACYWLDQHRIVEALTIQQMEVTIEGQLKEATGTNGFQKITKVVTAEENIIRDEHQRPLQIQTITKVVTDEERAQFKRLRTTSTKNISKYVLQLRNFGDRSQRRFLDTEGLPAAPTTLTVHGNEAWVGGTGFVALVDLNEDRIKKIAYVPADKVEQIQVGGGYVWVQYEGHLYRVLLGDL